MRSNIDRPRPEIAAGGYSAIDGTVEFFTRVRSLLPESAVVLDFGASRGSWREDPNAWRRELRDLRGHDRTVIGADVDAAIAENTGLDGAVLLGADSRLPLRNRSIDLVVADSVFEHLADPPAVAKELTRVVAPGGWVCARTPNRWGYVGIGARFVPDSLHTFALRRLQPLRKEVDVFGTEYAVNTRRAIRRTFPTDDWLDCSYTYNPDPDYAGRSLAAYRAVAAWQRVSPRALGTVLLIFMQRRPVR